MKRMLWRSLILSTLLWLSSWQPAIATSIDPCEADFNEMLYKAEAIFVARFKELLPSSEPYDGVAVFEPTKVWRGDLPNSVNIGYIFPEYLHAEDKEKFLQRLDVNEEYLLMIKRQVVSKPNRLVMIPYSCRTIFSKKTWAGELPRIAEVEQFFAPQGRVDYDD